jgi:dolichol-phosphate mannosyltransferase
MTLIPINQAIKISVVIPSYQEEENLRVLLPRIIEQLIILDEPWEVVVVDTMIPLDATKDVCDKNQVRYATRQGGENYGDAVRTCIKEAQGDFVIFMDADGSHSPNWISKLYIHRNTYDVVVASRYVEKGYTENTWILVMMSKILNITYRVILNINCNDVSNSFRLYHREQIQKLVLKSNHFDIVEEILVKLNRHNHLLSIHEVPFTFKQRMYGRTKRNLFLFMLTYLYTLIKLRFLP